MWIVTPGDNIFFFLYSYTRQCCDRSLVPIIPFLFWLCEKLMDLGWQEIGMFIFYASDLKEISFFIIFFKLWWISVYFLLHYLFVHLFLLSFINLFHFLCMWFVSSFTIQSWLLVYLSLSSFIHLLYELLQLESTSLSPQKQLYYPIKEIKPILKTTINN